MQYVVIYTSIVLTSIFTPQPLAAWGIAMTMTDGWAGRADRQIDFVRGRTQTLVYQIT